MADKESIGAPIANSIKKQIVERQKFLGSTNRNKFVIAYNNGNNAFAILRSSVNVNGSSNLAKSYTLGTALSGGISKQAGTSGAYNLSSTTGIRPKPGITSISVSSKGTYGTLLLANIQFKVYSKEDLDAVESVYFRPGFTALLEYGHSIYTDNDGTVINMSSGNTVGDAFFSDSDFETLETTIDSNVSNTDHNYEALFGYIQNFSWSIAEDGSYDCSVKLVSKNHVLESIQAPPVSSTVKEGEVEIEEETPVSGYKDLITFIMQRLERETKNTMFNAKTFLSDKSKTGGNVSSVASKLKDFYAWRSTITIAGTGWLGIFPDDTFNLMYIRLGDLLDIINTFCILKDDKGKPIAEFYTGRGEKYNTFPEHHSTNPLIALPPKLPTGDVKDRYVKRTGGDGKELHAEVARQAGYYGGGDEILNIVVSTDFIKRTMAGVSDGPQEQGTGIFDFLKNLLAGIEVALGGVNNFIVFFDGKTHRIVDSGNRKIKAAEAPTIEITGLKSTVYSVDISSKLSNKIGSQIAIAAGGSQGNYGENVANMIEFNSGKVDRHVKKVSQTPEEKNQGAGTSLATEQKKLQELITKMWDEFNNPKKSFDAGIWDELKKENTSRSISDLERQKTKKSELGSIPVPIELSLTMKGIGGFKLATVFKIPTRLLPAGYEGFGFIITGLDHNISQDNRWTTTVRAKMYKLG